MFVLIFFRLNDFFCFDIVLLDLVIIGVLVLVCMLEIVGFELVVMFGFMKNNIVLFCLFILGGVRDNDEFLVRFLFVMLRFFDIFEGLFIILLGCFGLIIFILLEFEFCED